MSFETVKRTFSKLEKQGYLITGNFNKDPRDKTKWYTIDNEKLFHLYEEIEFKKRQNETKALFENVDNSVGYEQVTNAFMQNDPMQKCRLHQCIYAK